MPYMQDLLLHLPFIVRDSFKDESPDILVCFVKLIQIVQYTLSPIIYIDMLVKLESLIASHQELFIKCYGSENLIPKMHMSLHLPEQIRQHGPTRHHWTMRFEAKNAIAKNKKYFHLKNLSFSISEYFQIHFASNSEEKKNNVKGGGSKMNFQFFNAGKRNILVEKSYVTIDGITDSDVGEHCISMHKVIFNSVSFSVDDIVFSGNMISENSISKIVKILLFKEDVYFHCNIFFVKHFKKNMY